MIQQSFIENLTQVEVRAEALSPDTMLLHRFLLGQSEKSAGETAEKIVAEIARLTLAAPFRQMQTPGGRTMSAALSNCGLLGWVTDRQGYRYQPTDPDSGRPWPAMPELFRALAQQAAAAAGYAGFNPDVCLLNRYQAGARMSLHQDRDEKNLDAPIVSFSLGLPALFLWGGLKRGDGVLRWTLEHGDALVWGRSDRLRYHGIAPLPSGQHPLTGAVRYNLTFRQTGLPAG
ncbi:MAG: DNA oxidative demethylase AlkB [Pseudomonadales bacterium]|nr:DNA oxidative demethylase AlkB [Pseudomonadales bacterium]